MSEFRLNRETFTLTDFQNLIQQMYSSRDEQRGVDGTFMWLMEEVGELAAALRQASETQPASHAAADHLAEEFADVLAWLVTIANVAKVDLQKAVWEKYGQGCPGCGQMVCECDTTAKP
ncbi:MAG: nucleotide pyrophosphohydrolase [Planctomycetes bacterium]|nr:nucleotide pyrophosphohydrolase [Planctomycetota bacterium]